MGATCTATLAERVRTPGRDPARPPPGPRPNALPGRRPDGPRSTGSTRAAGVRPVPPAARVAIGRQMPA
ncbi:hypothetical protein TR51_07305 [Kitasatospora griseola]|uniref:Uncharacterized protein n=1 Tax=Kitasatospora griseola TaxID=2064 RepID=A0A0D0NFQ8_KITGR|nr:hypothetical protein TR51_07305 [Kitasatospora griseola]